MNSDKQIVVNGSSAMSYHVFVEKLIKKYPNDKAGNDMRLLHSVLGIAGEAGELVDAIKKHVIYGKELDLANVVEELGDLNFYMQDLQNQLMIHDTTILNLNAAKLGKRYAGLNYSGEAAIARADKLQEADRNMLLTEGPGWTSNMIPPELKDFK